VGVVSIEVVGGMKDKELKLEKIEDSHTILTIHNKIQ
jgi:hypothetical protein